MKRPVAYGIYLSISIIPVIISMVVAYGIIVVCSTNHTQHNAILSMAGAFGSFFSLTLFGEFHSKHKEAYNSKNAE